MNQQEMDKFAESKLAVQGRWEAMIFGALFWLEASGQPRAVRPAVYEALYDFIDALYGLDAPAKWFWAEIRQMTQLWRGVEPLSEQEIADYIGERMESYSPLE